MSGPEVDPKTLSAADKLNFLITQVARLTDLGTRLSGQMESMTRRMNRHDSRLARLEKKPQEGEPLGPNVDGIDSEPEDGINVNAGRRGSDTGCSSERASGVRERRGAPGGGDGRRTGYGGGDGHREGYDDFYGRRNDDFYGRPRGGRGGQDGYDGGFHHPNRYKQGGFSRSKLNFPSFDGESDPLPWLTKCASYFRGMRTMEEEKVWMAALHLEGAATEWYYALERDHGILSWPRFSDFVNMRFGPPLRTNGMAELKDLHCTGTVDEYTRQFSLLLCRCNDLSMPQQVNMFTTGLGEPLRTDVELQSPTQLQTAMSLARAYERRDAIVPGTKGTPSKGSSRVTMSAGSTGTALAPQKSTTTNKPRFKQLSPEELAAKRANGECYHYPEKYSVDHKCTTKRVFLIQLDADMDEEDVVEDLGISLHALTGIGIGDTMKLHVAINGSMLVALVDSGSTHTFI
jgi:hypothetical protein